MKGTLYLMIEYRNLADYSEVYTSKATAKKQLSIGKKFIEIIKNKIL